VAENQLPVPWKVGNFHASGDMLEAALFRCVLDCICGTLIGVDKGRSKFVPDYVFPRHSTYKRVSRNWFAGEPAYHSVASRESSDPFFKGCCPIDPGHGRRYIS
jgi:hypothetical protein